MSFGVIRSFITKPKQTQLLISELGKYFNKSQDSGTLYLGYPLTTGTYDKVTLDAMLISELHGMIVFIFEDNECTIEQLKEEQDTLYYNLDHYLKKYNSLRQGRKVAVSPTIITIVVDKEKESASTDEFIFSRVEKIGLALEKTYPFDKRYYKVLCEALQKVANIRPHKKRNNIVCENSKGWIIKEIEKEIANLDEWQKKAALEFPDGPQRIRGLAGTGKTIVLALKAAYLHTQYPDWHILVTFYTRSLKQQYEELIEKFVNDFSGEKPDWEHLCIFHAWGNQIENGVYYNFAQYYNVPVHTLSSAIGKFGRNNTFKSICDELLEYVPKNSSHETFDAILIDEAQDLPSAFFKIIFKLAKPPKRIIWAYDELQNLSDVEMPSIEEMFDVDEDGVSQINIENIPNEPQRDIILPICYRNPPWTLAMAHALGFGLYNKVKKIPFQTFEQPEIWRDIGYSVIDGQLEYGKKVTIERSPQATPDYFKRLLSIDESISSHSFKTTEEQYQWVAQQIDININKDELDPDDILIIFPNSYTSKSEYSKFSKYLQSYGILSFLAGINSSQDTFRFNGYVTCSGIYRAKGNEAPMVYILNSEYCFIGMEIIKQRNILFTAITRSRAWVRICGVGTDFDKLNSEFNKCKNNEFRLSFKNPTKKEMKEIRKLNRERTKEELTRATKIKSNIDELITMLESGELDRNLIPEIDTLANILSRKR